MSVTESIKRLAFIKMQSDDIKKKLMLNFNCSSFWSYSKQLINVAVI